MVFETEGKVARVDARRKGPSNDRGYFVAIRLAKVLAEKVVHLHGNERRGSERAFLLDNQSAFIQFNHPLFPECDIMGPISDISASGLSFICNPTRFPIISGMILEKLEVQLPFQNRFKVPFTLIECERTEAEDGKVQFKGRGEFVKASTDFLKAISQTAQSNRAPEIFDATSEDYEKLWEFMFETGFIYGDKRKQIQSNSRNLFRTYKQLLGTNSPIVKKLVFKHQGEIKAHLSAIRIYDEGWIIQHLNAIKSSDSPSAARDVILAIADFFLDPKANERAGNNYMACFYRPENLYPAMLFGEVKSQIGNKAICDSRDLDYCILNDPENRPAKLELVKDIEVRPATPGDLEQLEQLLVERGDYHLIRLEGLTIEKILRMEVSREFEALKLYRYRKVFSAIDQKTGTMGFAICNYASPGINLSELTNSFRLYFPSSNTDENAALAKALTDRVLQSYYATEMQSPILLAEENQFVPPQFLRTKSYRYWSFDLQPHEAF